MFTISEHWRHFADFCCLEMRSGGPDPQLGLVREMSRGVAQSERWWRFGCYIAVYNVPYAEVLWREWSWRRYRREGDGALLTWLRDNWQGITTRVERRCARRPEWMVEFFAGYARFVEELPALRRECARQAPEQAYELLWARALRVPRLGRYVALKLLELLTRDGFNIQAPDIRPRGGWSPRATLATLWEDPVVAAESDAPGILALVNQRCTETITRLRDEFGVEVDLFKLQVMLCEYRESWEGRRQYPGRSLDSELKYARKAEKEWGRTSDIWRARLEFHLPEHLGEIGGWDGPRDGAATALADYGYTWSDLLYDYSMTTDFSQPSCRAGVTAPEVRIVRSTPRTARTSRVRAVRLHEIIPGKLYQSSRWTVMDVPTGLEVARASGITGLVNFWKDNPDLPKMVSQYWWYPLSDGRHVPVGALGGIVAELAAYIRGGGVLLSMCYGGRNRSGLVSALLVRELCGCSGREAVETVQGARRGALVNEHFARWVRDLSAPEKGSGTMMPGCFL